MISRSTQETVRASPRAEERAQGEEPAALAGWCYVPEGKRDLRVDLLRGFAVFAMVVDHIGGSSWLYAVTGGNRFFVSAAEAFVFISGLMVGMIYGSRARRGGLRSVLPTVLGRAWTLYVLSVWLAISTALIATLFGLPGAGILAAAPARFILQVIAVRRTFYLVDVMLLYSFLMLLAPLALYALLRSRWWLVLVASWTLWGAYQFAPSALQLPWPIIGNSVFKLASWQVLFFTALVIGFERHRLSSRISAIWPRSPLRDGWLTPLYVLLALMIWMHVTDGAPLARLTSRDPAALLDAWFDKSALPPARLLACAIVFTLAWVTVTRFWRPIRAATAWLLMPLGQAALYAYAAHLFLIPVVDIAIVHLWGSAESGTYPFFHPAANALIQAVAVLALWGLTRARFLQSVVEPLGQPPLLPWRRAQGDIVLWRPSDGLAAIMILAVASSLLLPTRLATPATPDHAADVVEESASEGQTGQANPPLSQKPVSTVTAPRKVGGAAKGSTTGSQPTPQPAVTPQPTVAPSARSTSVSEPAAMPEPETGIGNLPEATADSTREDVQSFGYLEDREFYSPTLDRVLPYGVYLPPGYNQSDRRYPVLYMLHGAGGHYSEWIGYGLAEIADTMIETRQIPPLIIVVPQGDFSFWVNHSGSDDEHWGDYLVNDVIAEVDANFRTLATPSSRAVGGLSMGGFGALSLGFTHPELFAAVGAHSPSLRTPAQVPDVIGGPVEFALVDPVELATEADPTALPRLWIDVGDDDEWAPRVNEFHTLLRDRGIKHHFLVTPGLHDSNYWSDHIVDYLRFYASAMTTN